MESIEQMEAQLEQIFSYCKSYEGRRDDVFTSVRDAIIEHRRNPAKEDRRERLTEIYSSVISTLLLAADPPHEGNYSRVLEELSRLTGSRIDEVLFDTDPSLEAQDNRPWTSILSNLPQKRSVTPEEQETLNFFSYRLYDRPSD